MFYSFEYSIILNRATFIRESFVVFLYDYK